jgi:hypothetical protein
MQQRMGLGDVVRVGRRGGHALHQPLVCVRADMGFHPVVPLLALLGLVHLGVARAGACALTNANSSDQGTTRFISSKNSRLRVL